MVVAIWNRLSAYEVRQLLLEVGSVEGMEVAGRAEGLVVNEALKWEGVGTLLPVAEKVNRI